MQGVSPPPQVPAGQAEHVLMPTPAAKPLAQQVPQPAALEAPLGHAVQEARVPPPPALLGGHRVHAAAETAPTALE